MISLFVNWTNNTSFEPYTQGFQGQSRIGVSYQDTSNTEAVAFAPTSGSSPTTIFGWLRAGKNVSKYRVVARAFDPYEYIRGLSPWTAAGRWVQTEETLRPPQLLYEGSLIATFWKPRPKLSISLFTERAFLWLAEGRAATLCFHQLVTKGLCVLNRRGSSLLPVNAAGPGQTRFVSPPCTHTSHMGQK